MFKKSVILVVALVIVFSLSACGLGTEGVTPTQELPEEAVTEEKEKAILGWKTATINIDYGNPELYLASGAQSSLNEKYSNEINTQLKIENNDMSGVAKIFRWKQSYFRTYSAGGKLIGKTTVNRIMEEKTLSGCHDHALVLVSVLREYGFPAIMIDAAGIQWALDYSEGKRKDFAGHVFVEVYVNNNWILINSTSGEYVLDYDPHNPVIPMTNSDEAKGYFALLKGLDPEDYGVTSIEQLKECMKEFAKGVKSLDIQFPQYEIKMLPTSPTPASLPKSAFSENPIYKKFFHLDPDFAFEIDKLPVIEDGISDEEKEALEDIYSLYSNAENPEIAEAFDLIIKNGNPYREKNAEIAKAQQIAKSITVDGNKDDWQDLKPISTDAKGDDKEKIEGTDILAVYSIIDEDYLYVAFETDGQPNKDAQYIFLLADNEDGGYDYAIYFNRQRAWLWDLRDYDEKKGEWPEQSEQLNNTKIAIDEIVEFMMPVTMIGNPAQITLYPEIMVHPPVAVGTDWASSAVISKDVLGWNTQLQTLFELALDNEFEKDDTTALAIALANGFIRTIGDETVIKKVREDDNGMLNLAREISSWQEENGLHLLNSLPLEAKIAWAWRGTCGVTGGPGPSWNSQGKINLETYEWNTVDIEILEKMREHAVKLDWISQDVEEIVKNLEDYFHTYGNWLYTCKRPYAPDAPQQDIVIDGVKVSNCGFSNVDFNFQHFLENDFAMGGCRDLAELNNAWFKAIGMSSAVFRRVGAKDETYDAATDPEDLPHYFTIYYEPEEQVWKAYEQQILSGVPPLSRVGSWPAHMYIWLMPVKQADYFERWKLNNMGLWDANFVFIRKMTYEHLWELLSEGIPTSEMKQWLLYTDKARLLESAEEFKECVISLDTSEKLSNWMIENIKGESYYEREKEGGVSYTPPPDETFETRSGNCRVFATFSCYILQYHSYEAEILSIKVESNESMNHVVCVYRSDGSLYVINNGRMEGLYQNYEDIASAHHEGWSSYEIHYSWDKYQKMGPPDKVVDREQ